MLANLLLACAGACTGLCQARTLALQGTKVMWEKYKEQIYYVMMQRVSRRLLLSLASLALCSARLHPPVPGAASRIP